MKQKSYLETIVNQVAARFGDAHPRVRWAAINAMGQLETDLGPDLQNQFHQIVLPALVSVMDDVANPRVQSHAAAAVINFTENCKKEVLEPYLMGLLGKLGQLLAGGVRIVQEQAITAIASVADCVEGGFGSFYPSIMPVLKHMLQTCTKKDERVLNLLALLVQKSNTDAEGAADVARKGDGVHLSHLHCRRPRYLYQRRKGDHGSVSPDSSFCHGPRRSSGPFLRYSAACVCSVGFSVSWT